MDKELTAHEETEAPSTLDLLLGKGILAVNKNLPTARYEVSRLSEDAGAPVIFTLQTLPYGRVQEIKRLTEESDIQILLAGCIDPDLKAPALKEKFKGVTPAETVRNMLLAGEISDLSAAVEQLTGYRRNTIREVKNG